MSLSLGYVITGQRVHPFPKSKLFRTLSMPPIKPFLFFEKIYYQLRTYGRNYISVDYFKIA